MRIAINGHELNSAQREALRATVTGRRLLLRDPRERQELGEELACLLDARLREIENLIFGHFPDD